MEKKALIIYEIAGLGHEKVAGILAGMLEQNGYIVTKLAMSSLLNAKDAYFFSWTWNYFVRRNLVFLANAINIFSVRLFFLPLFELRNTERVIQKISEQRPAVLISTIHCYNKILAEYSTRHQTPFFVFITEVFPTFLDTVAPGADHFCYFNESRNLVHAFDFNLGYYQNKIIPGRWLQNIARYITSRLRDFRKRGPKEALFVQELNDLPKNNNATCFTLGPFSSKEFFEPKDRREIAQRLGLCAGQDTILIASGSIGGRFVFDMLKTITAANLPVNVLAVCGKDKTTLARVQEYARRYRGASMITAFGFVDFFDELLTAADAAVCRPSAQVFIECLLKTLPFVTLRKTTFNDHGGLRMIEKYGLGEICDSHSQVPALVSLVLRQKHKYRKNIKSLLENYPAQYEEKEKIILDAISGR